jgi:hypothetical protein
LQAGVADSPAGTDSSSSSGSSSSELLSQRVKGNEQLITGQLSNGLRYVLLPNRTPPQRFEAHLEVHAGSVDEREHEQVRAVSQSVACNRLGTMQQHQTQQSACNSVAARLLSCAMCSVCCDAWALGLACFVGVG